MSFTIESVGLFAHPVETLSRGVAERQRLPPRSMAWTRHTISSKVGGRRGADPRPGM